MRPMFAGWRNTTSKKKKGKWSARQKAKDLVNGRPNLSFFLGGGRGGFFAVARDGHVTLEVQPHTNILAAHFSVISYRIQQHITEKGVLICR